MQFAKLTEAEKAEIERLVECAITASSKALAIPYIKRLEFMQESKYLEAYTGYVFSELISSVKTASGQVKEKEHWVSSVKTCLYKLINLN